MCSLGVREHILAVGSIVEIAGGEIESENPFSEKILFSLLYANGSFNSKILLGMCSWYGILQLWFCDAETIFSVLDLTEGDGLQPQKNFMRSTKK